MFLNLWGWSGFDSQYIWSHFDDLDKLCPICQGGPASSFEIRSHNHVLEEPCSWKMCSPKTALNSSRILRKSTEMAWMFVARDDWQNTRVCSAPHMVDGQDSAAPAPLRQKIKRQTVAWWLNPQVLLPRASEPPIGKKRPANWQRGGSSKRHGVTEAYTT